MSDKVLIRFVTPQPKGPSLPGRPEWVSESQATALVRAGHAEYVDSTTPETAMVAPAENAMRPSGRARRVN